MVDTKLVCDFDCGVECFLVLSLLENHLLTHLGIPLILLLSRHQGPRLVAHTCWTVTRVGVSTPES